MDLASESAGIETGAPEISVIVPADGDGTALGPLIEGYLEAMDGLGRSHEMIVLHDPQQEGVARVLGDLATRWPSLQAIAQRPWTGEDGALKIGIARARGELILTLPGWPEIEPSEIATLFEALGDQDLVTGARTGRSHSGWQKTRMGLVHGLVRRLFGRQFEDVFCRVRLGRADMFREIADVGVRQHFLPVLAAAEGFSQAEVPLKVAADKAPYSFKPLGHLSAFADILALYVVLKFLRRPLRFFGAIGLPVFLLGLLITGVLVFARLFMGEALADRPALVFGVLMIVLGLQILAMGLIGEIVIFSSSRRMKTYAIDKIIRGDPPR